MTSGNAQVVVPAGALAQNTEIEIEQTDAGAPPLPEGVVAFGPVFAFTPHGTSFAVPVSVTLPYDPASVPGGEKPRLYKTNASHSAWEQVPIGSIGATSVTAQVSSFSYFVVGSPPPPPLARAEPERSWIFEEFLVNGTGFVEAEDQDGKLNHQIGGTVSDEHDFGPLPLAIGGDESATGAVFSSETGTTYWVYAQGPRGSILSPNSKIGNRVTLVQKQGFRKKAANARLRLHVTRVFLEAVDANGTEILYPECPWTLECGLTMSSAVTFDVRAYAINTFFSGRSSVELYGHQGNWRTRNKVAIDARSSLWKAEDFTLDGDAGGFGSKQHAIYQLKEPITVEVDISRVPVEGTFTLLIEAIAETMNRRQRESYVAAYFRDPLGTEGTTVEAEGLEVIAIPFAEPPPDEELIAPECTIGNDDDAGTLQFAADTFLAPEVIGGGSQIVITRTGGNAGEVSATVRTHNGTALAGSDYEAVEKSVYFGNGDDEPRVLELPLILDDVPEEDKELTVTLSDPRGCAQLGLRDEATVIIQDDDRPEPEAPPSGIDETFGTNGLATLPGFGGEESGMALQADGKIVMVGGRFSDFVLARFNADGTPDASFGDNATVTTDMGGFGQERARTVAIQPDGKIVVAGEATTSSGDLVVALARYNTDGSLDTTFGSNGKVISDIEGRAFAIALLPDGRILIAGDAWVANPTDDFSDFLLARFTPEGELDPDFADNGWVVTSIAGPADLARNLVVQPDGKIVISGYPIGSDPSFVTGVVRYNADGTRDSGFGSGGIVAITNGLAGRGLALQADGKLVLVGSIQVSTEPAQFAVMRLNEDGNPDDSFGSGGLVTNAITDQGDFARAVAIQADGRILVAGTGNVINPNFVLMRYNVDGNVDSSFAIEGQLEVDFFGFEDRAEHVALLPDGRIIVGGRASSVSAAMYGLIRVNP